MSEMLLLKSLEQTTFVQTGMHVYANLRIKNVAKPL